MTTPSSDDLMDDARFWFTMWTTAEGDYKRTKVAWMNARRRAMKIRKANHILSRMANDTHHRLTRELERTRELTLRVYELERKVTGMRQERGL